MNHIAIIEFTAALFVAIALIGQFNNKVRAKSFIWLRHSIISCFLFLIVDALAYILEAPACPFALVYIINFLAYTTGPIVFLFFTKYCEAYIGERADIKSWTFHPPFAVFVFILIATAVEFIAGNIIVYENGAEAVTYGIPLYLSIIELFAIIYVSSVAVIQWKSIGWKAALLLGIYNFVPVLTALAAIFTGMDYTAIFGAISLMLVSSFLQTEEKQKQAAEELAVKLTAEKAREELIASMSGGVESLYIVNPQTEQFRILSQNEHLSGNYSSDETFTESITRYIELDVFKPDREKALEALDIRTIARHLETEDEYDVRYRDVSNGYPHWYEMHALKLSDTEIIYNFTDINDKVIAEGLKNSIFKDQFAIFTIDLDSGFLTIQKQSPWDDAYCDGYCCPYGEIMTRLAGKLEEGSEDRTLFTKLSDINYLRQELAEDNKRTYNYVSAFVHKWVTVLAYVIDRHEDGSPSEVVMGFSLLDSLGLTMQELLEQEAVSEQFISQFVEDYDIACKVSIADDSYTVLKGGEELTGCEGFVRFSEVTDYLISNLVFESDRARLRCELTAENVRRKLSESSTVSFEYRIVVDGITRWDNMTVSALDDNYVAVGIVLKNDDIILNHLQEKEYENYYALFAIDMDTAQITNIKNESWYDTGKPGEIGPYGPAIRRFSRYLDGEAADFFRRMSDIENVKALHEEEDKLTYVFEMPMGDERRWVRATSYAVIRHDDGTPAVATLGFNLMDSMSADRQAMQEKLQSALDAAQSASKAKTDFLFNMSHDIRTPMNAIIGFTNMALKHLDDRQRVEDSLTKTQEAGELLLSLINDILDMSRIESGKIELEENEGDVYLSFANIESTMQELADARNIDLSFEVSGITDRYVYADFSRCMRVFVNIITNAIKYTNPGGFVRVKCVQTGYENGFGFYRYTFEDNGIGMSEEFQKRVFDEFAREETATVSGIQGTGLGLTVCRTFVAAMNGTIECQSTQGKGSIFTVTLPFRLQEGTLYTNPLTGHVIDGEAEAAEKAEADFSGRRILLVEDNELNREIAEDILSEEGMETESAGDGSVAVQMMMEKGPDYYDFILMDIQMPIMNGYEATKAIRAMYPKSHIPIIALSANAFDEDKVASLTAGMNDHVAKPIDVGILKSTMAKYM